MSRRRIGVAIAVPDPWGAQLQASRERLGDPLARSIVPHVTLLPPTLVRAEGMDRMTDHLGAVAGAERSFVVHLRGSATFRPVSPVVFVPLVRGISDCEHLEGAVRCGPLQRSIRFPYHPHVTVAHDLPDSVLDRAFDELAGFEASFVVDRFVLFEQGPDGVWQPRQEFVLAGGFATVGNG